MTIFEHDRERLQFPKPPQFGEPGYLDWMNREAERLFHMEQAAVSRRAHEAGKEAVEVELSGDAPKK